MKISEMQKIEYFARKSLLFTKLLLLKLCDLANARNNGSIIFGLKWKSQYPASWQAKKHLSQLFTHS
jgi:hypothetical protein